MGDADAPAVHVSMVLVATPNVHAGKKSLPSHTHTTEGPGLLPPAVLCWPGAGSSWHLRGGCSNWPGQGRDAMGWLLSRPNEIV